MDTENEDLRSILTVLPTEASKTETDEGSSDSENLPLPEIARSARKTKSETLSTTFLTATSKDKQDSFDDEEPEIVEEFQIEISQEDFQKVCRIELKNVKLKPIKTKPAEEISVRTFGMQSGYGDKMFKYFHEKNPNCLLGFDKTVTRRDDELGHGGAQLRVNAHCARKGCTGKFSFTCIKIPVEAK